MGNNRKIDGFLINVKQASYGWKESRRHPHSTVLQRKVEDFKPKKPTASARKDDRSYKEVLVGSGAKEENQTGKVSESPVATKKHNGSGNNVANMFAKVCNFDLEIPKNEMEWLHRSAKGVLGMKCNSKIVQDALLVEDIRCQVCPMGGVSVLVTFETKEEMELNLRDRRECFLPWFESIVPWNESDSQCEIELWVSMEEVPLLIWHEVFFKSLGDSWGSFIRLDDNTAKRKRFDVAKMLFRVESRINVPSSLTVNIKGVNSKIWISIEDPDVNISTMFELNAESPILFRPTLWHPNATVKKKKRYILLFARRIEREEKGE